MKWEPTRALDMEMGQSLSWAITSDKGASRTQDTDTLVVGLPNSLVTIGLGRPNLGAGLVGVLTGILGGIPEAITTDSTARQ